MISSKVMIADVGGIYIRAICFKSTNIKNVYLGDIAIKNTCFKNTYIKKIWVKNDFIRSIGIGNVNTITSGNYI